MNLAKCELLLNTSPKRWLITGVAGFIGSNLLERLLRLDQTVVGLDDLSTGFIRNLEDVQSKVTESQWQKFRFIKADIRDLEICKEATNGADIVLHHAAQGSVPGSISDPIENHLTNLDGFLNVLVAARDAKVTRVVYATSSAVYGDLQGSPKVEGQIGKPLSPYAVTKYANELYADVFGQVYAMDLIGLRYFNVFGPRQDPDGAYAAVIPQWFKSILKDEDVYINGDGETSRDFCFVENVVQANLLAACIENKAAVNQVYNIAVGQRTTLLELYEMIHFEISKSIKQHTKKPVFRDFRLGDVRHSLADISKAKELLGFSPTHTVSDGLAIAADYYMGLYR